MATKQHFGEDVFVFSRTLGLDDTFKSLNLPKTHMYQNWDEGVVREIMAYSKRKRNGILLLLDDLISDGDAFNRKNNTNLLSELFYTSRHYRISLCITTQRYHAVQSALLANASAVIVFRLKTQNEERNYRRTLAVPC